MSAGAPSLAEVAAWLDAALGEPGEGDPPTLFAPSARPLRRLGVALEAGPGLAAAVEREALDALLLHRPWGVEGAGLAAGVGVLACHGPFDRRLAPGVNPDAAAALGLSDPAPVRWREGVPVGMVADFAGGSFAALLEAVRGAFGGWEEAVPGRGEEVRRVAVVEAMTGALVREVADRGASAYITGQFRAPGREAVRETGMGVVAVGHRRAERWALGRLAGLLQGRFPETRVLLLPDPHFPEPRR